MKITDDVEFVRSACLETRCTVKDQIVRCGQECIILNCDNSEGLLLCLFSDCKSVWFPKSCVVEDESEEPEQFPQVETPASLKTLRDEIAMAAMESLLFSGFDEVAKIDEAKLAEMSYKISDAMMEARKK